MEDPSSVSSELVNENDTSGNTSIEGIKDAILPQNLNDSEEKLNDSVALNENGG